MCYANKSDIRFPLFPLFLIPLILGVPSTLARIYGDDYGNIEPYVAIACMIPNMIMAIIFHTVNIQRRRGLTRAFREWNK